MFPSHSSSAHGGIPIEITEAEEDALSELAKVSTLSVPEMVESLRVTTTALPPTGGRRSLQTTSCRQVYTGALHK